MRMMLAQRPSRSLGGGLLIRQAHEHDWMPIWSLGMAFHAEFGTKAGFPPLDAPKAKARIYGHVVLHTYDRFSLVAERDHQIVGALLLERWEYWYSTERCISDMMFYVAPEHRGTRAARGLIDAAKELAGRLRCRLMLTVSSGLTDERVDRFYRRAGLKKVGAAYLLEG